MIDDFRGNYRFLSNFHLATVVYDGVEYPSTEHAYQAAKTLDPNWRTLIRMAATPRDARRLGQTVPLRADWTDDLKLEVMRTVVQQKFVLHADLRERLLATGDQELVEGNTWNDRFWGVCRGEGENHLGQILMDIRNELRA